MARNWAITVGINEYPYLRSLQYATRDADAMRQLFLGELGFQQVYHFTDTSPPIPQDYGPDQSSQPTYTTLRRFLNKRFETPFLGDGDNLWFFFAGHGIRHEQTDYLMPLDGDRADLQNSAIPIHFIANRLRNSGADNVILLIDACRSYEGRRDGIGLGLEKQQGVITLFSCSPEESSYEIQELQQGAFTHVLLQSLRLQGEGNCATVERLYQRLRYYVPQLTRQYKRDAQTPYGRIEPLSKNHLILLPQRATLGDVVALKNDALTAEIERDLKTAEQLWIRVLMVSPGDPQAITAIKRLSREEPPAPPERPYQQPTPAPTPNSRATSRAVASAAPMPLQQPSSSTSRSALLNNLSRGVSRRKALQVLGLLGGSIGTFLLGKTLVGETPDTIDASITSLPLTASDFTPFVFEVVTVNEKGETISQGIKRYHVFQESIGDVLLGLVPIPGGTFQMGSPDGQGEDNEKPQHPVTVPAFLMGRYEVTQAQWKAVSALPKVERDLVADPSRFKGVSRPVEKVSWDDAIEFCRRLSRYADREYRLPSEAEWEYACRAETTTPFHFGGTLTAVLANYNATATYSNGPKGKYREQTTEVGNFPANGFGLYDMHGNVWEWCLDHWHNNYGGAPTDGSVWLSSDKTATRLLRGGSWFNNPDYCRSAIRDGNARVDWDDDIGFRVVCAASWTLP
ncbi:MAG: SUMF1/EgtB/PvdO family nonheme iron enzyme [Phormidesmis sp.]